ncbi:hypothetical protein ACTFSJ_27545 [Bacillus cereus group sp. MYBK12-2]|uniref:phage terminase large subunit family protein n=1 Tax=Bacillus cereus group sp. MYBK12-2 TaxID=3450689 RepID=UPI0032FECCF5|nr:hypothetical protein [Bacillus pacificus]HDR7653569.1 hypothetical protein [Bacillus pacificus]
MSTNTRKKLTRKQKVDLAWLDQLDPDRDWEGLELRLKKLQIKRDVRYFDRYVLGHTGAKTLKLYQLAGAAPMIYVQRMKIQKAIEEWMHLEGCFSEEEITAWSMPRFEWPEERITEEQLQVVHDWRKKYKIKDDTDWTRGIRIPEKERKKLDEYKQISILQPRQTGKSEVVVRVNIYVITIVPEFASAVFAPTEKQAKAFIFQRTRDYTEENPFYKGRFKTLNALDMKLQPAPVASGSKFAAITASPGANIEGDSLDWAILDESQDITDFKVKKSIKFMMAAKKGSMIKIGTVNTLKGHFWESTTKKGKKFWYQVIIYPDVCAACRPDWAEFTSKAIEEDGRWSDTIRMSVFLEWLLTLGMFITEEQWDSLVRKDMDFVEYDKTGLQYTTIDVAKTRDETVVGVWKILTNYVINGRYPMRLLNVKTLPGVDYDTQYEEIKAWIDENYNVAAVGIDDTGGRGGLADRFMKTQYRVEAFNYTKPSKSEWYTNLQTMLNAHYTSFKRGLRHELLFMIPGSEEAQKTKYFRDFAEQMLSLQREYSGKYLVVHHPELDGAKDDYPDMFMMGAWMASRVTVSVQELMDKVQEMPETKMDKLDWDRDQREAVKHAKREQRQAQRKFNQEDDELAEIMRASTDLDSIF